jgi:hypothetical protein
MIPPDRTQEATMSLPPRSLFRQEALDYRLQRRGQSPPVTPAGFLRHRIALWTGLAVIVAAAFSAFLQPVPASAVAIAFSPAEPDRMGYVALMLDPDDATQVEPGARVTIAPMDAPGARSATVVTVEATPVDPATLGDRLGLPPEMRAALAPRLVLAWIEVGGDAVPAAAIASATVELRDIRAGSVIPVIGRWFGGAA